MIISQRQIPALAGISEEKFTEKTVMFLKESTPTWASSRTDDEIRRYIEGTVAHERELNSRIEKSNQGQLIHWVKDELLIPLATILRLS